MGVTFTFSLEQTVNYSEMGIYGKVDSLMLDRDSTHWAYFRYININKEIKHIWVRESDLITA